MVGAMDYTPITFTSSQHPLLTSFGHELVLSIGFESDIQHLADRPEGYYHLPDAANWFHKEVSNAWDKTKLIDGYPGMDIIIAHQKGNDWYIGGIHAENREKSKKLALVFLPEGTKYKLTFIADGSHDKEFSSRYMVVDKFSEVEVKILRREVLLLV
jgi:alpha-glucosidase